MSAEPRILTWGCWVGCKNATSVLRSPPSHIKHNLTWHHFFSQMKARLLRELNCHENPMGPEVPPTMRWNPVECFFLHFKPVSYVTFVALEYGIGQIHFKRGKRFLCEKTARSSELKFPDSSSILGRI